MTQAVIVGAGPIGIEVAVALKHAGIDVVHLEAGDIGATMGWWAPGTTYFSSPERIAIAGVPLITPGERKATREEYMAYLRAVAAQFDLQIQTHTRVTDIEQVDGGFALATTWSNAGVGDPRRTEQTSHRTSVVRAENVILAIGDMHLPQTIGVEGEDRPHVSHYLDDPHRYYGREVLIVGGKNSAIEAVIRCYRVGAKVTLCHRGELDENRIKYWLLPEVKWLAKTGRIQFFSHTSVREITDDTALLEGPEGQSRVRADDVLLLTGYQQDASLFESAGIDLVGNQRLPWHDPETMETNVRGIYVAGTATAGTQVGGVKVFIETCHHHADRIAASILGTTPESHIPPSDVAELPES